LGVAAQEREHHQEKDTGEAGQPRPVEAARVWVGDVGDDARGDRRGREADWEVDEEDPPPAKTLGDQAAEQRSERDRAADRCAQAAIAVARSEPENSWPISASAVANIAAPPIPWAARAMISNGALGASPHNEDAAVKITTPQLNTRWCSPTNPSLGVGAGLVARRC
jgi:hypothetical protein